MLLNITLAEYGFFVGGFLTCAAIVAVVILLSSLAPPNKERNHFRSE